MRTVTRCRRRASRCGREQRSRLRARARGRSTARRGLEADRQPEQSLRAALALPAVPRLELRAGAAEARRVLDRLRRRPRRAGRRRRRRRRTRSGTRSRGSGRSSRRGGRRDGRRAARSRLHALEPNLERLQPALEQPRRVGRGDEAREPARQVEALVEGVVGRPWRRRRGGRRDPPSTFVALCSETSQPSSSGRSRSGDASVASQTTGAGWAAAASKSGIVSIGFDGRLEQDQVGVGGGRPVWSYSTTSTPHGRRWSNSCLCP